MVTYVDMTVPANGIFRVGNTVYEAGETVSLHPFEAELMREARVLE